MLIMRIKVCLTVITLCVVNGDDLDPYRNRQRINDQYISLGTSAILLSNTCNLRNLLDEQLYETVQPEVNKIGGCYDTGLEHIGLRYSTVRNVITNPNYMCETYTLTHNCVRSFIPHVALCYDNVANSTVTKLYTGGEIGLEILCENDAEIYSILYRNRNKKCIKHFVRRYDQKFKDIWSLSEPTLFSSEYSCTILSTMVRKIRNRPPHCNEQLANTLKRAIEKFWTKSGCSNIITFS